MMRVQVARCALLALTLLVGGALPRPAAEAADTDKLLFTARRDGKQDLYLANPDGRDEKTLRRAGAGNGMGVWSPDEKKIAFISKRSGNPELYLIDADGSNVQRLTTSPEEENQPSWSSDGKKIAFCRSTGNIQETYDI